MWRGGKKSAVWNQFSVSFIISQTFFKTVFADESLEDFSSAERKRENQKHKFQVLRLPPFLVLFSNFMQLIIHGDLSGMFLQSASIKPSLNIYNRNDCRGARCCRPLTSRLLKEGGEKTQDVPVRLVSNALKK